jgi:hypothetical protein
MPLVEQELVILAVDLISPQAFHGVRVVQSLTFCVVFCQLLLLQTIALSVLQEELEDTKGVIRNRISKKNRQHNGQKKKDKRTNNDLQNIHIKLKIE